jgi:hypothetical protein
MRLLNSGTAETAETTGLRELQKQQENSRERREKFWVCHFDSRMILLISEQTQFF